MRRHEDGTKKLGALDWRTKKRMRMHHVDLEGRNGNERRLLLLLLRRDDELGKRLRRLRRRRKLRHKVKSRHRRRSCWHRRARSGLACSRARTPTGRRARRRFRRLWTRTQRVERERKEGRGKGRAHDRQMVLVLFLDDQSGGPRTWSPTTRRRQEYHRRLRRRRAVVEHHRRSSSNDKNLHQLCSRTVTMRKIKLKVSCLNVPTHLDHPPPLDHHHLLSPFPPPKHHQPNIDHPGDDPNLPPLHLQQPSPLPPHPSLDQLVPLPSPPLHLPNQLEHLDLPSPSLHLLFNPQQLTKQPATTCLNSVGLGMLPLPTLSPSMLYRRVLWLLCRCTTIELLRD